MKATIQLAAVVPKPSSAAVTVTHQPLMVVDCAASRVMTPLDHLQMGFVGHPVMVPGRLAGGG